MEGSGQAGTSYVLDEIAAELGITPAEATPLLMPFLQNKDLNGDGQNPFGPGATSGVRGNLIQRLEPPTTLHDVGGVGPQKLVEGDGDQRAAYTWTYNPYGQVTSETDAEENVHVYLYYPEIDPDGNGVNTGRPVPGWTFDAVTGGHRRQEILDTALPYTDPQLVGVGDRPAAENFDLGRDSNQNPPLTERKRNFFYDIVGHRTAEVDPRGVRRTWSVNEVDEVWKMTRAADTLEVATRFGGFDPNTAEDLSGQDFAYREFYRRDANGNVIEIQKENSGNLSDQGARSGYIETSFTYDLLNNLKTKSVEYGQLGETATWSYAYDASEHLSSVIEPEGNVTSYEYDDRDLLWKTKRGAGTSEESVTTKLYDANGKPAQTIQEALTVDQVTEYVYDGFDRLKTTRTPEGSEKHYAYDRASNVVSIQEWGKLDGSSSAPFVELRLTEYKYDERSRRYQIDRADPQSTLVDGDLTAGDGKVTTRQDFDRLSRRTFLIEDDKQYTASRYDGSGRILRVIDSLQNEVQRSYDDNGNLAKTFEIDKYPNGSTRSFETLDLFDSLNRRLSTRNNLGEVQRFGYDSRDNLVSTSDANGLLVGGTNGPGNTKRLYHNGFDLPVREEQDLRVGGTGSGVIDLSNLYNPDGKVTLRQSWDKNKRLTAQLDDRNKATRYVYDTLSRKIKQTFADLTQQQYSYDRANNLVAVDDARGNHVVLAYDLDNRKISVDVTVLSPPTVGTTAQVFEYDGLNRRTKSTDSVNGTLGDADDWTVERTFDALDRIKEDKQNGRSVVSTWKEESKRTSLTYPTGSIGLTYTHDALDRISQIQSGGSALATYTYSGRGLRIQTRTVRNGNVERHHDGSENDSAYYDGVRRPLRVDHFTSAGVLQTAFEHAYDRAGNRGFERRIHDASGGDNYVYDSLYRLTTFERNVPASDVGLVGQEHQQTKRGWSIDGVQNWMQTTTDGVLVTNVVNNVNEYTSFETCTPSNDVEGNLWSPDSSSATVSHLYYDIRNRLRRIESGSKVVLHDYDAEDRRVRTTTSNIDIAPSVSEYVHDSWQIIEERDTSSALQRRYVMGVRTDEPVRIENLSFYPGAGTYNYQQTTLGSVCATTDAAGNVVERYTYDAYGAPRFEAADNTVKPIQQSDYGNPYLFAGRRFEPYVQSLYEVRTRNFDPVQGRFAQRDSIGLWGDRLEYGNPYAYVGNNPSNRLDPIGRDTYSLWSEAALSSGSYGDVHLSTFTTTKNAEGKEVVDHTYSFGDRSTEVDPKTGVPDGKVGWTSDTPESKKAAQDALDKGKAKKVGGSAMDPEIRKAYKQRENSREKWGLDDNCITHGNRLQQKARRTAYPDPHGPYKSGAF